MKNLITAAIAIVAIGGGYYLFSGAPEARSSVVMPALSSVAAEGEIVFQGTCAACHGTDLTGTETGPPLLHPFYKPGHHSDAAIVRAVQAGSAQHHWRFGDMPPQPQIADADIVKLIAYIREVQRANGVN